MGQKLRQDPSDAETIRTDPNVYRQSQPHLIANRTGQFQQKVTNRVSQTKKKEEFLVRASSSYDTEQAYNLQSKKIGGNPA